MEENVQIEPDFNHYLNAFITSARAVKWIMNKEYSNIQGWKEWDKNLSLRNDKRDILKMITKIRNISQKEHPLITNKEYVIPIPDYLGLNEGDEIQCTLHRIEAPSEEELLEQELKADPSHFIARIEVVRIIDEIDNDILYICQDYYKWLESIVIECETLFNQEK